MLILVLACSLRLAAEPLMLAQSNDEEADSNLFEEAFLAQQEKQQALLMSQKDKQYTDFEHVLFEYFQKRYEQALTVIAAGDAKHQFAQLSTDDQDRLRLMQGASMLNVGLQGQGQALLLSLLSKTSSEYVQANTWFWLAKSAFSNKQFALSEQAFLAIEQGDLSDYLAFEEWQELRYQTVYARMQTNEDWRSPFEQLSMRTIYPAYILANDASMLFNRGDYEAASTRFIDAKQALLSFEQSRESWFNSARDTARSVLSFDWINPFSWFSSDQNALAQGVIEAEQEQSQGQEIDALYDTINLGLSHALLQQQADEEAFEVIRTVSAQGGETEQAMLTFGWALAQQNRWQSAIDVWQYLQQQSIGLYGLQASYAQAYAHQQKGDFAEAYFALENTTSQIFTSIDSLQTFSEKVNGEDFFDSLMPAQTGNGLAESRENAGETGQAGNASISSPTSSDTASQVTSISQLASALGLESGDEIASVSTGNGEDGLSTIAEVWPSDLLELKRLFLSKQSDIDAAYLLKVRQESLQAIENLAQKTQHLDTLKQMLAVREQRFVARQQSLSLQQAEDALNKARDQVALIEQSLKDEQNIDVLNLAMATPEQSQHLQRIAKASERLERLLSEQASPNNTLRRPVNPKLQERLERVKGIMQWQLDDVFIVRQWDHKRLLKAAKRSIDEAQESYNRLAMRQQDNALFSEQQAKINEISQNIAQQQVRAQAIFERVDNVLRDNLLMLIEQRIADLNRQQVNTRLAKLRLQDLTPEAE